MTILPPEDWGWTTVQTPSFRLAQRGAAEACRHGEIALFFGDAGLGKTHAIEHFLTHQERRYIYVKSSPAPAKKEIFEELLCELTGSIPSGSAAQLRRDCIRELRDRQPIVVIDEAQHLSYLWLQQLRSLHDEGRMAWPLFLVGGVGTARRLKTSHELWSRMGVRVEFQPLNETSLLPVLAKAHPILERTDPATLRDIDRTYCRGVLRDWKTLLRRCMDLLPHAPTRDRLTAKVVAAAMALRAAS